MNARTTAGGDKRADRGRWGHRPYTYAASVEDMRL
jgi:hypothetical protein